MEEDVVEGARIGHPGGSMGKGSYSSRSPIEVVPMTSDGIVSRVLKHSSLVMIRWEHRHN